MSDHVPPAASGTTPPALVVTAKPARWKYCDLNAYVRTRSGTPAPMNFTTALRCAGNGLPVALIVTFVYGNEAAAPSLNQIGPSQLEGPVGLSLAIQWICESTLPWIVPLAASCG